MAAEDAETPNSESGEDALARIRRLIAEGGMTAVVQREQSTTMASMGGFGNNIIVSHRIHRGSQTGARTGLGPAPSPSSHASDSLSPPSPLADPDEVLHRVLFDDSPGPSGLLLSPPSPSSSASQGPSPASSGGGGPVPYPHPDHAYSR